MSDILTFRAHLKDISESDTFLDKTAALSLFNLSIKTLEAEPPSYRPRAESGEAGGLLDFSSLSSESGELPPVIVVPDLHARADFLLRLLDLELGGSSVLTLLESRRVIVVCVGDAFHAEARAYKRWVAAFGEWLCGSYTSEPMREEMLEDLNTLRLIMELKNAYPSSFHFLKGNHENILNETGNGNYAFRKFVMEGAMCFDFMESFYGDEVTSRLARWESRLPVCTVFRDFGVSHAEPSRVWDREAIINCRENADVVLSFTWTGNGEAEDGSVRGLVDKLCPSHTRRGVLWFGGHRPVTGAKYYLRQGGAYLQLHNPSEMNVAVVRCGAYFEPERDIISL